MKSWHLDDEKAYNKLVVLQPFPVQQFWYASQVNMKEFQPFLVSSNRVLIWKRIYLLFSEMKSYFKEKITQRL